MPRKRVPLEVRFWSKVLKSDGCWLWQAALDSNGYGTLSYGGRTEGRTKAHRVSWELHYGSIPDGKNVLHRCDNPTCIRPDHLFLGTQQDNVDDMIQKGRMGRTGPVAGTGAKLNLLPQQVAALKVDSKVMTQVELAKKYGIGQSTVSRILRGVSAQLIG